MICFQFYHDQNCSYQGQHIGNLENIDTQTICQASCILSPKCIYFLYDFDAKECQLYMDGDRNCMITVGPALPTIEECSALTTSPYPSDPTDTPSPFPSSTEPDTTTRTTSPFPSSTEPDTTTQTTSPFPSSIESDKTTQTSTSYQTTTTETEPHTTTAKFPSIQ